MDEKVMEAAMMRSSEQSLYYSHDRPDGRSCFSIFNDFNLQYGYAGENIAAGYANADDVMDGWMNSSGHRANILNNDYNSIGIGVFKHNGIIYYTQLFTDKSSITPPQPNNKNVSRNILISDDKINLCISSENLNMYVGDKESLFLENINTGWDYSKAILNNYNIEWTSSNENVVNVSELGILTANGKGSCIIKATLETGKSISCEIQVLEEEFTEFTVNPIRTNSTAITGKGLKGATVKAYIGNKQIGNTATVDSSSNYKINISKQSSGSKITVKMTKPGYKEVQKIVSVINISQKYNKSLTKDIYKYDIGKGKYLTYINGKGYSQYTYLNASGKYAFTPSSWMKAAGLNVSMPTKENGYTMAIDNNYIGLYNEAKTILEGAKSRELSKSETSKELNELKEKELIEEKNSTVNLVESKASISKTLTKDIYKYDAGKGKYQTYINGKGYSQYVYLNTSEKYAFTPSSWMRAAGLTVTMPSQSNGYTMKITNPYISKYKDTVKEIETQMN